jgi:hypothetical protein
MDIRFLSIDHVNNDGANHRKEKGKRINYEEYLKSDCPYELQTLCYNCNCGKGKEDSNEICPHNL